MHAISLDGQELQEVEKEYFRQAVGRAVCHILISKLPDAAIPEVLETLGDAFSFHAVPPSNPTLTYYPTQKLAAREGRKYVRPDIELTEE